MTEHPSLETPGSLIRSAREGRGFSLLELSELTKIPPPVLEAIERDEYHKVSGALYIKSFLRACASEVGLDPEEVLTLYSSFSGEVTPGAGGADMVWEEETVEISRIGLPWRNIALVGVVLVLAGFAALVLGRGCDHEESDPAEVAAETEIPVVPQASPVGHQAATQSDTLAGGWQEAAEIQPVAVELPVVKDQLKESVKNDPEPKPEAVADTHSKTALPLPLVGSPSLIFAGGKKEPVVLRVICDRPLKIQAKRDAEQTFQNAVWPPDGIAPTPLPATGIESGKVYAVSRGLVVYWGARDHFSLRLDRTDGVEVTVNGKLRNIRNLRPGGEIILDDHQD